MARGLPRATVSRLIEFLTPFRIYSQNLKGNKYPMLPYALPVFECLRKHCLPKNTDCNVRAAIREKALYFLYEKVELKMEYKVACLLWPHMKTLISLSKAERELVWQYTNINKLIKSGTRVIAKRPLGAFHYPKSLFPALSLIFFCKVFKRPHIFLNIRNFSYDLVREIAQINANSRSILCEFVVCLKIFQVLYENCAKTFRVRYL